MPPPSPPRPRGPKPTKVDPNQILDAAQAVFAEDGLRAASLRAIARRAGCDPSLIYYHFDSKETLFQALLQRRFPAVLQDIERLADPANLHPTALRLWDVLLVYHRHLKNDPGLRSMIRGEIVHGAEGLADQIQMHIRPIVLKVRSIFDQGMARGDLRPDLQPLLMTFFLVRMQLEILDLFPAAMPRLMHPNPEPSVLAGMHAWFELFWRGVALDPTVPLPPLTDPAA